MMEEHNSTFTKVSLSFNPLMTKEEQLLWAEKIRPHAPHCVTVYNNLVQHGRGLVSNGTFYVIQGLPTSHIVVYHEMLPLKYQHITVFCMEEEVDQLTRAFRVAPFVNWRGSLALQNVPHYLLGPLQRLAKEKGVKMTLIPCICFIYHPHLDTQPLKVGPGFHVYHLGRAGIQRLIANSRVGSEIPLEVVCSLAQQVPYVGVYRDTNKTWDTSVDVSNLPTARDVEVPVAWVCSSFQGSVGKLMTEEGYKRRGFGRLITTIVARRQAMLLGFIPYAIVEASNSISQGMFMGLQGWEFTHEAFWMTNISEMPPS